jgi:hypothetical protein
MQPTAYTHRLSTESGPLGGKRTHYPEVRNLGLYHYASGPLPCMLGTESTAPYDTSITVKSDDALVPVHLWDVRIGRASYQSDRQRTLFKEKYKKCPLGSW